MLRICKTIKKHELDKLSFSFTINDIKKAYIKAKKGIGLNIGKIDNNVILRKVYLTSKNSAGRLLFLFFVSKGIFIPVILRLKNDKIIGNNLSMNNKKFIEILDKNFDLIKKDLENKNYTDYFV